MINWAKEMDGMVGNQNHRSFEPSNTLKHEQYYHFCLLVCVSGVSYAGFVLLVP